MEEQQNEAIKRGPGRPPKVREAEEVISVAHVVDHVDEISAAHVDEVTYVPQYGDPNTVKWNGITFRANVPVKISHTHTVLVPIREEYRQPDGTITTRSREQRIPMIKYARDNPCFSVNGATPVTHKAGTARTPTSPDEYRGWALKWISESTAASHMDMRWDKEEELRERCGVEDKDVAYLRSFFEARHEQIDQAA